MAQAERRTDDRG